MVKPHRQSALRYPLATVLGSEARVGVLRELFRHGGELSAPQLVSRSGFAQSSVREALISLEETQVIEVLGAGKALLYRASKHYPLYHAIDAVFAAEEQRYRKIVDGAREAAVSFHNEVEAVWLFGSVARGEDRFASDVDIALVAKGNDAGQLAERFEQALGPLQDEVSFRASVIGLAHQDVLRLRQEDDPLLKSLESDAVTIFGKRPDQLLMGLPSEWLTERTA